MGVEKIIYRSVVPHPAKEVYQWHLRPELLYRVFPPWESFKVLDISTDMQTHVTTIKLMWKKRFFWKKLLIHTREGKNQREIISDFQNSGGVETHSFSVNSQGLFGSEMIDRVKYSIPKWNLFSLLLRKYYRKKLKKIFAYKHDIIPICKNNYPE